MYFFYPNFINWNWIHREQTMFVELKKSRQTFLRSDVWENRRAPSASYLSLDNLWAMARPVPQASWMVPRRRGSSFPENSSKRSVQPIKTSPVRRYRPQDSLTYVGLRVSTVCNIETLKSVNGHVDLTHATSCTTKALPWTPVYGTSSSNTSKVLWPSSMLVTTISN